MRALAIAGILLWLVAAGCGKYASPERIRPVSAGTPGEAPTPAAETPAPVVVDEPPIDPAGPIGPHETEPPQIQDPEFRHEVEEDDE